MGFSSAGSIIIQMSTGLKFISACSVKEKVRGRDSRGARRGDATSGSEMAGST